MAVKAKRPWVLGPLGCLDHLHSCDLQLAACSLQGLGPLDISCTHQLSLTGQTQNSQTPKSALFGLIRARAAAVGVSDSDTNTSGISSSALD